MKESRRPYLLWKQKRIHVLPCGGSFEVPTVRCTEALEKPVPSPESLELLAVYKRSGMMP